MTMKNRLPHCWTVLTSLAMALLLMPGAVAAQAATDIPIWIELEKPQIVTVVIENEEGLRVRNLVAELQLPAGKNRLSWDGYDDGEYETPFVQRHDQKSVGSLTRKRVPPGTYRARGLTHDGLKLVYEFTAYSGGNPPWPTLDRTGAWLADHSCPLGAVFLPAGSGSPYGDGKAQVLLTSLVAEAGAPFVWVDLDGNTLHRRQLWGWWGAIAAARDAGTAADPEFYAHLVFARSKEITIRGLKTDGQGVALVKYSTVNAGPGEPRHEGHSIAVRDGLAVINAPTDDVLVFADLKTRTVLGTVPMPTPRALAFDPQGRLLVATENQIVRYRVARPAPDALPVIDQRAVLVASPLVDNPRTIAFDPAGTEMYVADWGQSHQVKVFSPEGKPLRTIGKASDGVQLGLYDESKFQNPLGLAIDDRGQLWIVDAHHLPKRVSVWNAKTGAHVRSHYGPPRYGGGGNIHPEDKTRFFYGDYYGLMEFQLDWEAGTSKPKAILVNGGNKQGSITEAYGIEYGSDPKGGSSRWGFVGDRPVTIGGRTYILGNRVIWLIGDDHVAWPVGFVGGDGFSWPPQLNQNFREAREKAGLSKASGWQLLITWSDRNGNRKVDADEYAIRHLPGTWGDAQGEERKIEGFVQEQYGTDLSMTANWGLQVPAPTFDANGIPSWDLSKAEFVMPPQAMFRYGESDPWWGTSVWPLSDGWTVSGWGFSGFREGRRLWSYPVTGADPAPRIGGGVVHPRRFLAPPAKAARGEAGYWYAVNGEKGAMFLMTSDGLFLQTLGGDMRNTPLLRFPKAERGMLIDAPGKHVSFEDEHYNPTMTQTAEGDIYLVAGKEHSSIFRVDGFPSVKRRDFGAVTLDTATLAKLPEVVVVPAQRPTANPRFLRVEVGGTEPVVDGKLDEYTYWVALGADGTRQASVRLGKTHLYAAWRTGDPNALANGGGDIKYLFKRGGAVDLMLVTDPKAERPQPREPVAGDLRLLVTRVDGQPKAVLYRPVVPGTPAADRVLFDSPVGSVWFDAVTDVSAQMKLAQVGGDIEIAIPLETLGLDASAGTKYRADFGLMRGDGVQTVQRIYWTNPDTLIVSDIPSEARLQPHNWGEWRLVDPLPPLPKLVPVDLPVDAEPGLRYARYKGKWDKLPDFAALAPQSRGIVAVPGLVGDEKDPNQFGLVFEGYVQVAADGEYTFTTRSNDGSRLWLGGALLIDNDGVQWTQDESRTVRLAAGAYPIRIEYFQVDGGRLLEVRWRGPGIAESPIPASLLFHVQNP